MKKNIVIIGTLVLLAIASCSKLDELDRVDTAADADVTASTKATYTEILTIQLDSVGELEDKIGEKVATVQKLVLSGPINAKDVETLRNLPALVAVDMKAVTIVGGDYYSTGTSSYRLNDNQIGERMFSGTFLSEIVLPDNITYIGGYAFAELRGAADFPFESIRIPNQVQSMGYSVFKACSNLRQVELSASLQAIPEETFYDCTSLDSVLMKDNVRVIGYNAFQNCSSLASIQLPDSLQQIGFGCFRYSGLKSITVPNSVTEIDGYYDNGAFAYCTALESVTLPEGLKTLKESTFYGCTSLTSINLPKSLTSIESFVFCDCSSLPALTFPAALESIGTAAFYGCTSLSNVALPASIVEVGESAFENCANLGTFTMEASTHTVNFSYSVFRNSGVVSAELPYNVKSIGQSCFEECKSLVSVTLPTGLSSLPYRMFYNCTSLENISIPQNIISISEDCLRSCSSLKNVTFQSTMLETIGRYAFQDCTSLESIQIPDKVTTIPNDCFLGCSSLSDITLPQSLETIEQNAFMNCTSLKLIDFSNTPNLTTISYLSFSGSGLEKIELPESVTTIDSYAFANCPNLTTATIPASVTYVDGYLFDDCHRLTSVFWNTNVAISWTNLRGANQNCLFYVSDASTDASEINNVIIDGISEEITITSDTYNAYAFSVPQAFKTKKITYDRYFDATTYAYEAAGWQTISLPFDVTKISLKNDYYNRTLAPFNATTGDDKPFWLRRLTSTGFENATKIEAGVPYIIAMPNNDAYDREYNISGWVTFSAEDENGISIPATGEMTQDVGPEFAITANYNQRDASDDFYMLNTDEGETYHVGSRFVRNAREAAPFEPYVTPLPTTRYAPAYFNVFGGSASTRAAKKPLGRVPGIDDM